MPPQTSATPEGRWEEARRHGARLRQEFLANRAKVLAGTVTKAEFRAYIEGPLEEREDEAELATSKAYSEMVAGVKAFPQALPPMPRQTPALSRAKRVRQIERYLERLRLHHNVMGKRFRDGVITKAQWDSYKRDVFYPRQRAAHAVRRAHNEAYDAGA